MSFILQALRSGLGRTIQRIRRAFGGTPPGPVTAAYPASTPSHDVTAQPFDPRHLSRPRLLLELLAPAPLGTFADLYRVGDAGPLSQLPAALEEAVARRLRAAQELLCRDMLVELKGRLIMDIPDKLARWLQLHCAGLDYEVFLVIYLDAQLGLITMEQLFRGTLAQVSVYPREILKQVIAHGAAAIVLAHNHPIQKPEPSQADQTLTQHIKSCLAYINVQVIDHFIVAGNEHYSFAQHGLL